MSASLQGVKARIAGRRLRPAADIPVTSAWSALLCRQTASGDNLAQMMDRSVPGAFW
jgi:hypothetical protein